MAIRRMAIDIDVGNNVFYLYALDNARFHVIKKQIFGQEALLNYINKLKPTQLIIEECGGANGLCYQLAKRGQKNIKLIPTNNIRIYNSNNSDPFGTARSLMQASDWSGHYYIEPIATKLSKPLPAKTKLVNPPAEISLHQLWFTKKVNMKPPLSTNNITHQCNQSIHTEKSIELTLPPLAAPEPPTPRHHSAQLFSDNSCTLRTRENSRFLSMIEAADEIDKVRRQSL